MFLTTDDFYISNDKQLRCHRTGYCFVFFMAPSCVFCENLKPLFNSMSSFVKGLDFAYMDVEQNNYKLVRMTQETNYIIEYVPLLIMFLNGEPVARFFPDEEEPEKNQSNLHNFIKSFTDQPQKMNVAQTEKNFGGIPGNKAAGRVCYLSFENAYKR